MAMSRQSFEAELRTRGSACNPQCRRVLETVGEFSSRFRFCFCLGARSLSQDKSRLDCVVKLLADSSGIELSCDRKSRVIKFSDIRTVLYTPEQLKRVDYSAGISGNDYCVALHLAASGNCIPLFFSNASDRDCFATTVEKLRTSPSAGTAAA